MKKILAVLLIFGSVSAALSAQIEMSAGLGGNFTADFNSYVLTQKAKDGGGKAEDANSHLVGGGVYGFFDATYVEANLGFLFGSYASDKNSNDFSLNISAFKLGLFGKFPIDLGGATFFPMLGIDGQIFMGGKYKAKIDGKTVEGDIKSSDGQDFINQFWFKAGVGFDIPIALDGKLFLRPEALYGIRLNTKSEQDALKDQTHTDTDPITGKTTSYTEKSPYSAIIGHGLDIRLALGYKF